jgi:catalase
MPRGIAIKYHLPGGADTDMVTNSSHPNAPKAIGSLPIPDSFADEEYHGIDAFIFVNKSGQRQAVRYLITPEKLVHYARTGCRAAA